MSDHTVYLRDYKAPVYAVDTVHLDFDLYDEHAIVSTCLALRRQTEGELCLYGDELELIEVVMDGRLLKEGAYQIKDGDLYINNAPDQCTLEIKTKIYPQNNTALSGLYRSNHLFCTQCEAHGFRRITFFPDRPDVLALYSTRICADKEKYPVLLSNGNLIDQGEDDNNRHWVVWQDPYKKPSYLFALVAGQLACVKDQFTTSMNRSVDLHIYVEPGKAHLCEHAMVSLKKAMRWDEQVYGREYDLDIFMIVAVSDFNMGAMENKGLNIFNDKYILVSPETATDEDYAGVESVVAHEYFHNWTGNRVTCRDWFQLSLKEGLTVFRDQEFSRDMNSRDVNRIDDVRLLLAAQFPEDASAMAHPVRPESYEEINNFYTATIYNKGAEVIRMQHTLLGKTGFRQGMDLYFERHDGQAVTIDDFVAAMEDANDRNLTQFKRWYSQAGTPTIEVKTEYEKGVLSIHMKQSCPPTPEAQKKEPFHIPVKIALFLPDGELIPLENDVLELKEYEQCFQFKRLAFEPLVSLLRGFSAPVTIKFKQSIKERLAILRFETDGYAKWQMAQQLAIECIHDWYHHEHAAQHIAEEFLMASAQILRDDAFDAALRAELLMPPVFQEVISALHEVDVEKIEQARQTYRLQLSHHLYDEARSLYEQLNRIENSQMHYQAFSQRKLRNVCLSMMMKANEKESIEACLHQFNKAGTMSDQLSAFQLLVNAKDEAIKTQAIADFYKQWQSDQLVVNKWLAVQASGEGPETLARVKKLMAHEAFNIKNPNKVRSLIGTFCMANHRNFHAADGSGYQFLSDMLLQLDKINPQVAAQLARPFTRWKKLDKSRQTMMIEQLNRMKSAKLSKDLNELVSKSLL